MSQKRFKNQQKTSNKTHRKNNDPKATKSERRVTKIRPTREGKGGIQDGILLEKKRILQNQTYCGERVHAGKVTSRHSQCQHAPAVGRTQPGGESRLPAAIVPPPGLGKIICMRKICKKFDARSMQVYFFAKYCLKRLISPTTNQNEHPRVQNNQNLALHGNKRDPI